MNFIKITEQPSIHEDLEQKSVRELLEGINEEDRKVASAVHACIPQIEKLVNEIVERMHQGGRIFYLGAGTSGRLGVLDASEIPATFGMPDTCVIGIIAGGEQALRRPVENAEDDSQKGWMELQDHHITNKDILIGIAASGTTPYVIGALQKAREHGILTASISSNPGSPLSSVADIPIEMIVGPEFITGSSRMKSGTGQKMILNMISTTVMIKLGRVKGNRMVNMQLSNRKLIDRGVQMLIDELHINKAEAKQLLQEQGSVKKALDASEIPATFGMPDTCVIGIIAGGEQALKHPVESAEDNSQKGWMELQKHHITNKDILIGIAASGTTPYVIGALQKAREHGILTASISSNPNSPLSNVADIPIEMIVGPEFITGSSRMKSGTGQKMILNMISTTVMIKLGRVKGNRMVNMQLSNQKLVDRGVQMLIDELHINKAEAKQLLQEQGSVKKAFDAYKTNNCITKND